MKYRKQKTKHVIHHLAPLTLAMLGALTSMNAGANYYFNPAFLSSDPAAVADLSRFSSSGQAPGVYRVDVWLNDNFLATRDITFNVRKSAKPSDDDTGLSPCLSLKSLDAMGVNVDALPALKEENASHCADIASAIPAASTLFDFERQRLDISIPQAALRNNARGYIPPEQWDEGINALMLNYDFTGSHNQNSGDYGSTTDNYFLGMNSGINL